MRFLLSKLRIFLFFPIPYLSQPLFVYLTDYGSVHVTFNGDRGKQGENGFFPRESDEDF